MTVKAAKASSNLRLALNVSAGWVTDESAIVPACTYLQLIAIE